MDLAELTGCCPLMKPFNLRAGNKNAPREIYRLNPASLSEAPSRCRRDAERFQESVKADQRAHWLLRRFILSCVETCHVTLSQ